MHFQQLSEFIKKELYQYLLIISPDQSVAAKITELKKEFATRYDCQRCVYAKPHITLLKFYQYDTMEKSIVKKIMQSAESSPAFSVKLNGINGFPSHTVYIQVDTKHEIVNISKKLRTFQSMLKFDKDLKPHFITEPHIAIARKLLPWQFEKSFAEWKARNFTAQFMAKELLLFKRRNEKEHYAIVQKFMLEGRIIETVQTKLF